MGISTPSLFATTRPAMQASHLSGFECKASSKIQVDSTALQEVEVLSPARASGHTRDTTERFLFVAALDFRIDFRLLRQMFVQSAFWFPPNFVDCLYNTLSFEGQERRLLAGDIQPEHFSH